MRNDPQQDYQDLLYRRHLLKGQEIVVLASGRRSFGICLLKECDWKSTFGEGDKRNLETVKTRETVRRSPSQKVSRSSLWKQKAQSCLISAI